MIQTEEPCPCMSEMSYGECCRRFHEYAEKPDTAAELMRSRYTAYYLGLVDYLVKTTHPDKLQPNYRSLLEKTKNNTKWIGLEVLSSSMGKKTDKIGKVHFVARYAEDSKEHLMEEHSRFRRYRGGWVYYDAAG